MPGRIGTGLVATSGVTSISVKLGNGGRWGTEGGPTAITVGDGVQKSSGDGTVTSLDGISKLLSVSGDYKGTTMPMDSGSDGDTKRQGRRGAAALTLFTMTLTKT